MDEYGRYGVSPENNARFAVLDVFAAVSEAVGGERVRRPPLVPMAYYVRSCIFCYY